MEKVKVGIIGCGGIANGKHLPSLKKIPEVELVAFCDIIPEKAEMAKATYGSENSKVYTDYRELLADPEITVVHVLTPNVSHSPITCDALDAGKHVMCEKPMAINSAEAQKMIDAAKRNNRKLTIGYQNRHTATSLYLKKEAENGTFGEIYYARAMALRRRAVPTWGVFLEKEKQGGGPLIDIGTHALDLTLWVMNNYKPKYCIGSTFHKLNNLSPDEQANAWDCWDANKFDVEDSAFGMIVMENGATIMLESSWALNTLDTHEAITSVCGTKAGADMLDGLRINGVRNGRQYVEKIDMSAGGVAFYDGSSSDDHCLHEARAWIDAVLYDKDPFVLPEQAIVVTKILEGIYKSAETGEAYYF